MVISILRRKSYTDMTNSQDADNNPEDLIISNGRCIIPNLNLVLEDSSSYLPGLTKLELLDVLNKANTLITEILFETNTCVAEENL